jgi:Family of unknown function (DUF6174)
MKTRHALLSVPLIALAALLGAVLLLYLPRALYTHNAVSAYNNALSKWRAFGPDAYVIIVADNSLTDPTAGWNEIRVKDGTVLDGHNPGCPSCLPETFTSLTVEALFRRIEDECLLDFPMQFCNVSYNEGVGYPVRLDTYPHDLRGLERPSVTIRGLEALKP